MNMPEWGATRPGCGERPRTSGPISHQIGCRQNRTTEFKTLRLEHKLQDRGAAWDAEWASLPETRKLCDQRWFVGLRHCDD